MRGDNEKMRSFEKSSKLDNVLYDVRGPVVDEAARMEEAGMKINYPDLASFKEATASVLTDNAATYGELMDQLQAWLGN